LGFGGSLIGPGCPLSVDAFRGMVLLGGCGSVFGTLVTTSSSRGSDDLDSGVRPRILIPFGATAGIFFGGPASVGEGSRSRVGAWFVRIGQLFVDGGFCVIGRPRFLLRGSPGLYSFGPPAGAGVILSAEVELEDDRFSSWIGGASVICRSGGEGRRPAGF